MMTFNAKEYARQIMVTTKVDYLPNQSDPDKQRFVFSYTISISNNSPIAVKLLDRSWLITDANGKRINVEGEGVVGKKPRILPQGTFVFVCLHNPAHRYPFAPSLGLKYVERFFRPTA